MIKTPKVPLHPDPESDGQPKSVIKVTFNETTTNDKCSYQHRKMQPIRNCLHRTAANVKTTVFFDI